MNPEYKDKLMQLFRASSNSISDDLECESRIRLLIHQYLQTETISSREGFESLPAHFANSDIPDGTMDLACFINYLSESVVPHSIRTSAPKFIGHMASSLPSFVRPLQLLITALNQNVVKVETSKVFTSYERQAIAMMHRLVYNLPPSYYQLLAQQSRSVLGMIVSGGTIANLTAIWCARNRAFNREPAIPSVEEQGMTASLSSDSCRGAVIIGSRLLHYSFQKVAGILGIGTRNLLTVPVDSRGRIELSALQELIQECHESKREIIAIVGIAGATDCGSIDPLSKMAEIAGHEGIHFHVDAAWGGPLLFSRTHRSKLSGIESADSVTIDGHKQLYLPVGVGLLLLRDSSLARVIEKSAAYIIRSGSPDLGRYSLEGSRPDRATLLQAALNIIGKNGYEFLIDEGIRKAAYMANRIREHAQFELLCEPIMNILVYRYLPSGYQKGMRRRDLRPSDVEAINKINTAIQKTQRFLGHSFVSRTTLDFTRCGYPVVALRAVIANPLTKEADIDAVLAHQIEIASGLPSA